MPVEKHYPTDPLGEHDALGPGAEMSEHIVRCCRRLTTADGHGWCVRADGHGGKCIANLSALIAPQSFMPKGAK